MAMTNAEKQRRYRARLWEKPWSASVRRRSSTATRAASSTAQAFTGCLEAAGVRVSMDGRGRWMDNVFIERLWRSLKYEAVYLQELADGFAARAVIGDWLDFYNPQSAALGAGGPHAVGDAAGWPAERAVSVPSGPRRQAEAW